MTINSDFILAMDIGGTKIAAGLVDQSAKVQYRQETLTLAHEGRDAILARVDDLGHQVMANVPRDSIRAVGAASAGQIDVQTGRVNYATENLPGWGSLDLVSALERLFGLPATADNDVNAMAVAELHFGAGRGHTEMFCAMVGTGIGGALIQNGRLYHGILGGAGEFGHLSIQAFGGRPCNCGGTGCVEAYASSRAVLTDFIQAAGHDEIRRRLGLDPEALTIHHLGTAFQDPTQRDWQPLLRTVAQAAEALGAGLASAVNLLSPELVVVAGSIQLVGAGYLDLVRAAMDRRVMVPRRKTGLCFSELGLDPGLVGIAQLARERLS